MVESFPQFAFNAFIVHAWCINRAGLANGSALSLPSPPVPSTQISLGNQRWIRQFSIIAGNRQRNEQASFESGQSLFHTSLGFCYHIFGWQPSMRPAAPSDDLDLGQPYLLLHTMYFVICLVCLQIYIVTLLQFQLAPASLNVFSIIINYYLSCPFCSYPAPYTRR